MDPAKSGWSWPPPSCVEAIEGQGRRRGPSEAIGMQVSCSNTPPGFARGRWIFVLIHIPVSMILLLRLENGPRVWRCFRS